MLLILSLYMVHAHYSELDACTIYKLKINIIGWKDRWRSGIRQRCQTWLILAILANFTVLLALLAKKQIFFLAIAFLANYG